MNEAATIKFNFKVNGWISFFIRNSPNPGTSDILCLGPHSSIELASSFAATIAGASPQGRHLYPDILIVFPKSSPTLEEQNGMTSFYSHVVEKIDEYLRETGSRALSQEFLNELKQRLKVKVCPDNNSESFVGILRSIQRPTAVFLAEADYFSTDVELDPFHLIESTPVNEELRTWFVEDVWVNNLFTFARACQQTINEKEVYLVLSTQQYGPDSEIHLDLLNSIDNCVLVWADGPEDFTSVRQNTKRWLRLASEQRVNEALEEIENSSLIPINKALVKAQCLNAASHPVWAFQVITPFIEQIKESYDPLLILNVSKVASLAGEYDLALELLQLALARNLNTEFGLGIALQVAKSILAKDEEHEILSRFVEFYPYSSVALNREFNLCNNQTEFERLKEKLSTHIQSGKAEVILQFYFTLAQHFASEPLPDFLKIIREIEGSETLQDFNSATVLICAIYAVKKGRVDIALQLYLTHEWKESFEEEIAWKLLSILENLFISENTQPNSEGNESDQLDEQHFSDDNITKSLIFILNYLSRHPFNGQLRSGLYRVLSPEISGLKGLMYIVGITLTDEPSATFLPLKDEAVIEAVNWDDFAEIFKSIVSQLQSPLTLGYGRLPKFETTYSPDQILKSLTILLERLVVSGIEDDSDLHYLKILLHIIILLCRELGQEKESAIISIAGAGLAATGRYQQARDIAEQCLILATRSLSQSHLRLAWEAYSDIYQRCNNALEAMIGLACAQQIKDAILSPDQHFHEQLLVVRLLRDFKLYPIAFRHLEKVNELIAHVSNPNRAKRQLDVMAIGIMLMILRPLESEIPKAQKVTELKKLADKLIVLQREAIQNSEEIMPTAMLLAQINNQLVEEGGQRSEAIDIELAFCSQYLTPDAVTFLKAFADPALSLDAIRNLSQTTGNPRYLEDLSTDRHWIVQLALRALSNPEAITDPKLCLYLLECMTNLSINTEASHTFTRSNKTGVIGDTLRNFSTSALHRKDFHLDPSEVSQIKDLDIAIDMNVQHPSLNKPADIDELINFSQEINSKGIELYVLGLASNNMLVKFISESRIISSAIEHHDIFDAESFYLWREKYPYAYKEMSTTDPFGINNVENTLRHIGIEATTTDLPCLLITDTSLQHIPPNLLLVNKQLAGLTKPIARAPSLSWLIKTRSEAVTWSGLRNAWILKSDNSSDVLTRLFDDVSDLLSNNDFSLLTQETELNQMSELDIAVIGAHGGVYESEHWFRAIIDEKDMHLSASSLAKSLHNCNLVILFICSGGRLDKHPYADATVGLPYQLLDHGCRTVIASPWPLDVRVPYHWLKAFLERFLSGERVIDANFYANQYVAQTFGYHPMLSLAMNIVGDPLLSLPNSNIKSTL